MIRIKDNDMKKTEMIILFITGFIVCSSWGSYLIGLLNIKYFIFELFFIPYFLYKRQDLRKILKKKNKLDLIFVTIFTILIVGVLFGTIMTNGDFIGVFTSTRPLFYIIIIARIFSDIECVNVEKVYIFCIGSIIGALIFINTIYTNLDLKSMWYYINSITLALIIIIPIIQKKMLKIIVSIGMGIIVSVISGYRINIIIVVVSILVGLIWLLGSMNKKVSIKEIINKISIFGMITFISFLFIKNFYMIVDNLASFFNMNSASVYRITDRLSLILSGNFSASQDNIRLEAYKKISSEFFGHLIPIGLAGKSVGDVGKYTDVPILYLYEAFGSVVTWLLIIIIVYIGITAFFISFTRSQELFDTASGLMFPILLFLLIINGTFISFANVAIITGIILGRWIYVFKLKSLRSH